MITIFQTLISRVKSHLLFLVSSFNLIGKLKRFTSFSRNHKNIESWEIYQIWEDDSKEDGKDITLGTKKTCEDFREKNLISDNSVMVLEFKAKSWEEACRHEIQYYKW